MFVGHKRLLVREVVVVCLEDRRTVDDGIEWRPLLEEDVDELVGHEARRRLDGLVMAGASDHGRYRSQCLGGIGRGGLSQLLEFARKRVWIDQPPLLTTLEGRGR